MDENDIRRCIGTLRREKIWNEKVKQRIEDTIIDDIERKRLVCNGYVQKMDEYKLPKEVMEWITSGRRKKGRRRTTW